MENSPIPMPIAASTPIVLDTPEGIKQWRKKYVTGHLKEAKQGK
jgi:hypothetical protein